MSFIYQDFETQSLLDLTITGSLKYVLDTSTRALLWSWAIDDDPLKLWCPDLSAELVSEVWAYVRSRMAAIGACPAEVVEALKRPDTYIVGWNQSFDFKVWRQVVVPDHHWPDIKQEQSLDAMAQGSSSNLPGKLDMAGRVLGLGSKTVGGPAVMKRFADSAQPLPGSPADIEAKIAAGSIRERAVASAIEIWGLYCDYALQDTGLMRDVWKCTRPLTVDEWETYWTSERINERGMMVDLDVCHGAIQYREEEAAYVAAECVRLTDGAITSPTLTKQINEWVFDRLPDDLAEGMVRARDEEGYVTRLTGDKGVMTRLLEDIALSDTPPEDQVVELLELLQFGRSSSAVKFEKMENQAVDSRIYDQYVFNGAGQSHRWSARGIQIHNLPRAYLDNELDVLDMIAARVPIEELRELGPVSATLAKMIRPTIIAPPGRTLVWADYSAVEARVAPWLANSRNAEQAVLDVFRNGDDLYLLNAEAIFNIPKEVLAERLAEKDPETKAMRQAAKVACIAEGQPVLTDVGLVPIEKVTLDMQVWDGQSFVSHQGSMFKGYKDVWEYDGLTATLDHVVWTEEAGSVRFDEAIRRGYHHVKSGAGRAAVRVVGDHLSRTSVHATEMGDVLCPVSVHGVWAGEVRLSRELAAGEIAGVSALHATAADSEMAGPPTDRRQGSVFESEASELEILWRAGGPIQVRLGAGGGAMDTGEHRFAEGFGDRSDRQSEWPLRGGQPPVGDRASAAIEQARLEDRGELGLHPERVAIRQEHDAPQVTEGVYQRGDHPAGARRGGRDEEGVAHYRGKVAVYDIANTGPDHRFTVSDCLVHNCLALGYNGGVGAYKAMARGYGMRVSNEDAQVIVDGWRDRNKWARQYGEKIQEAMFSAIRHPGTYYPAGHAKYVFLPGLMGGTLCAFLPDGRPLVYPKAKIVKQEKFGKEQDTITYLNGMARSSMWRGLALENLSQATAAALLRESIVRIDREETEGEIIGHTHDEIVMEVDEDKAHDVVKRLVAKMTSGFDWADGLPLAAEPAMSWYYTKNEKASAVHL